LAVLLFSEAVLLFSEEVLLFSEEVLLFSEKVLLFNEEVLLFSVYTVSTHFFRKWGGLYIAQDRTDSLQLKGILLTNCKTIKYNYLKKKIYLQLNGKIISFTCENENK